jgi:hypothetical protein
VKGACRVKQPRFLGGGMMKKQSVVALVLFLLIPLVTVLGGVLFKLINPEIAAGHPNYVRNYHLLNLLKMLSLWASLAGVAVLWVLVCILVIRSKKRSYLWLFLAALGPIGFAVLATLNDRTAAETDSYTRFVRKLNWFARAGYELLSFVIIWELAWQAMVLKSTLMIRYEAFTTGVSTAQIIAIRDASSGMWAFGEGMEVMYLAVLLYLLRPIVFRIVARVAATMASPKAR